MKTDNHGANSQITRRRFLQTTAAAGAGVLAAPAILAQSSLPPGTLNVGFIGQGRQGRNLLQALFKMDGVWPRALCDLWLSLLKSRHAPGRTFIPRADFYQHYEEMLAREKSLDAVIVAVPDFLHAKITNACLEAGLHVYCEAPMAHTVEAARSMVRTARITGKLLQVGHQRRSNPYYREALRVMRQDRLMGELFSVTGQWHQHWNYGATSPKLRRKHPLDEKIIRQAGYASPAEFYNWRWHHKCTRGPVGMLATHQFDAFERFVPFPLKRVTAFGDGAWAIGQAKSRGVAAAPTIHDHNLAVLEWQKPDGTNLLRGRQQTDVRFGASDYFERFDCDEGALTISELEKWHAIRLAGQSGRPTPAPFEMLINWTPEQLRRSQPFSSAFDRKEHALASKLYFILADTESPAIIWDKISEREKRLQLGLPTILEEEKAKSPLQHHLENFFAAVRGEEKLNCSGEVALPATVAAIRADESARTGRPYEFKPEDFKA